VKGFTRIPPSPLAGWPQRAVRQRLSACPHAERLFGRRAPATAERQV